jgi:hypothetical protein
MTAFEFRGCHLPPFMAQNQLKSAARTAPVYKSLICREMLCSAAGKKGSPGGGGWKAKDNIRAARQ